MKFYGSIDINQSLDKVTELFADPVYLKEYQEGFEKKVLIEGTAGKEGAISKMYFKHGKQDMILTETIISNQLPNSFEAFYHHKHMDNTMKCTFAKLENGMTRYIAEVEYTRIEWIIPKLMAVLFPSMYRKPANRWMHNFKVLAEKH